MKAHEVLFERLAQERRYRMTNCLMGTGRMAYYEAPNQTKTVPDAAKTLHDIATLVRSDALRDATIRVREYKRAHADNKKECTRMKMELLPAVTVAGYCARRKEGYWQSWSGYAGVDIDAQDHPYVTDWQALKIALSKDPLHTPALIYTSASGQGLHLYYPILLSDEMPYSVWYPYLEQYLNYQYGVQIDMALRSPLHPLTLAHDPHAIFHLS